MDCQQFAAQLLFAYLISPYYIDEIEKVFNCYQSPFDKRTWKQNKTEFRKEIIKLSNQIASIIIPCDTDLLFDLDLDPDPVLDEDEPRDLVLDFVPVLVDDLYEPDGDELSKLTLIPFAFNTSIS